jgi:hypothetical protein
VYTSADGAVNPEAYSHLVASVFVASVVGVLAVETLLEARLGSGEVDSARRALRRWACVGVALCCLFALFLDYEKGQGVLWMLVPLVFGPLLVSWFYVVRRFMRAVAFRLLPTAAFSFTSGALLLTSVHFDTPPFVLVLPTFLLTATTWAVVNAVRAFTVARKLSAWPPKENDSAP